MARRKLPTNMKKQNLTPIWIILAIVVVVVGLFVYRGARELNGNPIYLSQDEVPRLTVAEVQQAMQNESAVLLDVRTAGQYEASHVQGALSVPLAEIDSFYSQLDKDTWYITYCT
ncbi:MAG: rhodanese-like domain-containing protein [Anaerolineaceae bacterium]|jgi:3-mercaptopyruvate sulfurtransferase SseA